MDSGTSFLLGGDWSLTTPHASRAGPTPHGRLVPLVLVSLFFSWLGDTVQRFLAGIGGAVFFVSDGLIALRSLAGISLPAHDFLNMSIYIAAQVMLVLAIILTAGWRGPASGPLTRAAGGGRQNLTPVAPG